MNSLPPSIRSSSSRRCALRAARSSCVSGRPAPSPRDSGVGDARDLGQVRDREHLRALREPLQRRCDRVRRLAADASSISSTPSSVSHREPCLRRPRSRARRARARRPTRSRRPARTGARRSAEIRKDGLVGTGRPGIALAQLDAELALAHPDAPQLLRHGAGERGGRHLPGRSQLGRGPFILSSAAASASAAAAAGSSPLSSAASSSRAAAARASRSS